MSLFFEKNINISKSDNYKLYKYYNKEDNNFYLIYEFTMITLYEIFIHFFKNLNIKIIKKNENINNNKYQISIAYSNNYINHFKFNFILLKKINEYLLNFYKKNLKFFDINIKNIQIFNFNNFIYKIKILNDKNFINLEELNNYLFNLIYFIFNKDLYNNNKNNNKFNNKNNNNNNNDNNNNENNFNNDNDNNNNINNKNNNENDNINNINNNNINNYYTTHKK